jgi:hypothetical protein
MVAINSTVGKAENSSGTWMNSDVIRISTEKVIEMASEKSSNSAGSGRMRTTRIAIMASKAGLEECGGKGYASQAKCAGYMVTEGLTSARVLGAALRREAS